MYTKLKRLKSHINSKPNARLIIILSLVTLGCFSYLIYWSMNAYCNREEMKQLSPMKSIESSEISPANCLTESSTPLKILPQFRNLRKQNPDIFGWIKIDGTNIDYPVMFTPNDPEYYLHRNLQKKVENRGLPFLDGKTDILKSSNFLIYGHSMKDGTEFADLLRYQSKSFFQNHPSFHFSTIYRTDNYRIIGVLLTKVYYQNDDVFKYYQFTYPATQEQYRNFITNVKKMSLYDTGETATPGDQLITLSTCSYQTEDGRIAVIAKKQGR